MQSKKTVYVILQNVCASAINFINAKPAILEECEAFNLNVVFIEAGLSNINSLTFECDQIILVLSYSPSFLEMAVAHIKTFNAHPIILGFDTQTPNCSCIYFDRGKSLRMIADYYKSCDRTKTALFAINKNSTSDICRENTFLSYYGQDAKKDIFYNNGSIEDICHHFLSRADNYDSVICSNDITAVMLLNEAKRHNLRIPEDLFVSGYGNTFSSRYSTPSLTTIGFDYATLGKIGVRLFDFISRNSKDFYVKITMDGSIKIRMSTKNIPLVKKSEVDMPKKEKIKLNFVNDPDVICIDRINQMLSACDSIDWEILKQIERKQTNEQISSNLHIGISTLRYRIGKMCSTMCLKTKTQLNDTLAFYNIRLNRND